MTKDILVEKDIGAEIAETVLKLNRLASELPVDMYVQFSIGEIQSPRQNVNGYIAATVHRFEQ